MGDVLARLQSALGDAYRIEKELGGGGMSRVFLAQERELERQVVVKVLPPEMAAGLNAERFRREIQLAASLQHPHIVPLLAAGHADDLVYYTMPLIEGESLRAKLARAGELHINDTTRILCDVADALAYAHEHRVVHRAIKPDNVLIARHHAVVTDFGVAKALSESTGKTSLTSAGVALGTPAYMAPAPAPCRPASRAGGGGPAHRSPLRHLRGGGPRLRNADGPTALYGSHAPACAGRAGDGGAGASDEAAGHGAGGARGAGDAVSREVAGRPLADRRGAAPAARGDGHAERGPHTHGGGLCRAPVASDLAYLGTLAGVRGHGGPRAACRVRGGRPLPCAIGTEPRRRAQDARRAALR